MFFFGSLILSLISGARKLSKAFLGTFWYFPVRDSFYDCLGGSSILFLSSVFQKISGKDFSGFADCKAEAINHIDRPDFLACFGLTLLGFSTWTVISARIIIRIWEELVLPILGKLKTRKTNMKKQDSN
jgi:hypothetical protein